MKKLALLVFALMLAFGIAVFANSNVGLCCDKDKATACCCCKGDSCPMKKKDTAKDDNASCCDKCECCKGGSCPMGKKDAPKPPSTGNHRGEHSEHYYCACCGAKKAPETVAATDLSFR